MITRTGRLSIGSLSTMAIGISLESKRLDVEDRLSSPKRIQPKLLAELSSQLCTSDTIWAVESQVNLPEAPTDVEPLGVDAKSPPMDCQKLVLNFR